MPRRGSCLTARGLKTPLIGGGGGGGGFNHERRSVPASRRRNQVLVAIEPVEEGNREACARLGSAKRAACQARAAAAAGQESNSLLAAIPAEESDRPPSLQSGYRDTRTGFTAV